MELGNGLLKAPPTCEFVMWSYYKLLLTMLTISLVSECRLWKACLTTVWHSFQAKIIRAQRKAAPGCFRFTGEKGCCGGSSHGFWEKFDLIVVRGSKTQAKRKESGTS